MLSMDMMNKVVAYQRDDGRAPLPSIDQMIGGVEAQIASREQRLARVEAAVMGQLTEQTQETFGPLERSAEEMSAADPNSASFPQMQNIHQSVAKFRKIYDEKGKALKETQLQLAQRIQQYNALKIHLEHLKQQVKSPHVSDAGAFLKEFGSKVTAYAANPQHPRYKTPTQPSRGPKIGKI